MKAGGSPRARSLRGRFGALAAFGAVAVALWFLISLFQPFKGDGHGRVVVEIPRGAGATRVGDILAGAHVVSSGFFFDLRAFLEGKRGDLRSGRFVLREDMSYGSALAALTSSRPQLLTVRVTIPEGFARRQITAIARSDELLGDYLHASARSRTLSPGSYGGPPRRHSLEGFLFPDTYELLPHAPVKRLIAEQLTAFQQQFATVDLSYARSRGLTPYDVVIIASMVEREAQLASERPLIAAVIYNRLRARMPLGIDATIRYAIGDFEHPLTAAALDLNSPYNTRLHRGLPPTPVGNPGLAALKAAARPADVPYVYYVVKPGACGAHAFSTSYSAFLADVARYQSARAALGGRSPTNCVP